MSLKKSKSKLDDSFSKEGNASEDPNHEVKNQLEESLNDTSEERKEPKSLHHLITKDHPSEKIIRILSERVKKKSYHNPLTIALISQFEPSNINQALEDNSWSEAMKEKLD